MTESEIRTAVARGQGRAIQFLRSAASQTHFDLVLDLCTHDQTFDHYFEDRTDYMCRLVDTLPDPMQLVKPLGARLFASKAKCDRQQVRRILGHLRQMGSSEAREFLLKDFHRFRLKDRQFVEAPELLGLEGLELALHLGHRLEDSEIRRIFEDASHQFGKRRTVAAFRKLAQTNAEAERLVSGRERERKYRPDNTIALPAELINRLKKGELVHPSQFARVAKESDWQLVDQLGFESDDAKVLRRVRRVLAERPLPFDVELTLKRALHEPNREKRELRITMLSGTRHRALREWALNQLQGKKLGQDYLAAFELLELNAERRDLPILHAALLKLKDEPEDFHFVNFNTTKLRVSPTTEMLQTLYEHLYCGECRNWMIRRLRKRRAITPDQRKECVDDSDQDTRKWARRSLGSSHR